MFRPSELNAELSDLYTEQVRPQLGETLKLLKLDVVYERAEGSWLKPLSGESVLDLLGGYGSTILGHSHPEILARVRALADAQTPVHAQASVRGQSALLARQLERLAKTAFTGAWITHFSNTGTEAVEASIKHALLSWQRKKTELLFQMRRKQARLGIAGPTEEMEALREIKPVLMALTRSFHGKTSGALALTANRTYSAMYPDLPLEVEFIDPEKPAAEALAKLAQMDGESAPFSRVVGFWMEPVQCEGGIRTLPRAWVAEVIPKIQARQIPVIVDEIQTGLLRTGRWFASEEFGFAPDMVLLGKSLGGGIAKISATLIRRETYEPSFSMLHTSTFSEDDWSAAIALTTLELLQKNETQIRARAKLFEEKIFDHADELHQRFPGILRAVRAHGFLAGYEIDFDFGGRTPDLLQTIHPSKLSAYLCVSYLLHRHGVRTGVSLSAPDTIRIEPSSLLSDSELETWLTAIEDLVQVLWHGQLFRLSEHLWRHELSEDALAEARASKSLKQFRRHVTPPQVPRVGFLTHLIDEQHLLDMDGMFRFLPKSERERFVRKYRAQAAPMQYHDQIIEDARGGKVHLLCFAAIVPSSEFAKGLRRDRELVDLVGGMVGLAREQGCARVGLGQYTSIVTENGWMVANLHPAITTGNSLTAGLAWQSVLQAARSRGIDLRKSRVGLLGPLGNIGNVLAQLLGDDVGGLTFVHRAPFVSSPRYQQATKDFLSATELHPEKLRTEHELSKLQDCDIVICGTSSPVPILMPEHLKAGAIVLDFSIPKNVHPRVAIERPDVLSLEAGLARLPLQQKFNTSWLTLPPGLSYACLAETLVLGLHRLGGHYSLGKIHVAQVKEILERAQASGFEGVFVPSQLPLREAGPSLHP